MTAKNYVGKVLMYIKINWHYFVMIILAVAWYIAINWGGVAWWEAPDTVTYQITSIRELSWRHRLPGYQIISLFFYHLCGGYENANNYIVIFQVCMAIIGCIFFYDALYKYLHSKICALIFGIVNMMIIAMFGYSDALLTESLALSVMCIVIWVLVQAVQMRKGRYYILLSIISLCGIMIRPSSIFTLPCLAIFFGCFYIADDRKLALKGFLSLLFVTFVVLAYCKHNESLMGKFCLSDVSYNNALSSLIEGDMYDNSDYPEITEFIKTELSNEDTNYLTKAKNTLYHFGYDIGSEYIKDCKRLYRGKYLNYVKNHAVRFMNKPIVIDMSQKGERRHEIYEALRVFLLPWNYASMLLMTIIYLCYIICRSIKEKRFYYVDFGIVACILCIYIISLAALRTAFQRNAICLIPCTVFLEALSIRRLFEEWNKEAVQSIQE